MSSQDTSQPASLVQTPNRKRAADKLQSSHKLRRSAQSKSLLPFHAASSQAISQPSFKAATNKRDAVVSASFQTVSQPPPSFQAAIKKRSAGRILFDSTSQLSPSYQSTSQQAATKKRDAVADMQCQNLQKSYPTPSFHSTSHSTPSVQSTSQPAPSLQDTSQPASSFQAASQPRATRKYATGRESTQHWTVVAIDAEENRKKLKVKVRDMLNLTDKRVVLDFDIFDQPYGEAQGLLAGFCGLLASDCALFPINFVKWPKLPMTYFDDAFEKVIKSRFCFMTIEQVARRLVYSTIGKRWAANRLKLWKPHDDPLRSIAEIMNDVPNGVPRDQWTSFVNYQFKEETKKMRKRNAENRKKQTVPHIGGSKSNSRRRAEMMAETGQMPGRAKIYLTTHKYQDGEYVNEMAREICEKIEVAVSESTIDESEVSPNDAVGRVLGEEKTGRVRTMGLTAVPSRVFKQARPRFGSWNASSNNDSCSSQCQQNYKEMMSVFKTYVIMKEGAIPEQLAGFFASDPTTMPSDGSLSPRDEGSFS